ncbi:MAG: hypothetical protein KGH61_00890 [Candidatus Micrarchaeota archaeon]|nr:hypothetical protein [Candidatus Micrarchaeota archaeon]MDE1847490.1 hypothetical protein [Candidatus Micrarchaeota archaeon]MDE1863874.1 hypothetical protein [Candidatus Micrarchaeota archaeon]
MGGLFQKVAVLALSLLILLGTANAAGVNSAAPVTGTSGSSYICTNPTPVAINFNSIPLIGIAAIALFISFDVIAIGYVVGKLVPGTQLSQWVKREYWEVTKSAILIGMIYSALIFAGNIAIHLVPVGIPASGGSPFTVLTNAAQSYLGQTFCGTLTSTATGIVGVSNYADYFYYLGIGSGLLQKLEVGWYIPVPIPVPGAPSFTLGTEFGYENEMVIDLDINAGTYKSLVNDALTFVVVPPYVIIAMEYYLLPALVFIGLAFLIPFGLILRALPFLRGIGGTLIALGVGASIVFPLVLVLVNYPITNILAQQLQNPINAAYSQNVWWLNLIPSQFFPIASSSLQSATAGAEGFVDGFFGGVASEYPALNGTVDYSYPALLQFILIVVDLAITFPIIEAIARSLGGTVNIQFGKLRIK